MAIFESKDKGRRSERAPDTTTSTDGERHNPPTTSEAASGEPGPSATELAAIGNRPVEPDSNPDEIAPVPGSDRDPSRAPTPAPSSTGYRVAPGKSIAAGTGDLLDAGQEISPDHVAGGVERLEQLVKTGHVVKTAKNGERPPEVKPNPEKEFRDQTLANDAERLAELQRQAFGGEQPPGGQPPPGENK
jgi:hypothetical protein